MIIIIDLQWIKVAECQSGLGVNFDIFAHGRGVLIRLSVLLSLFILNSAQANESVGSARSADSGVIVLDDLVVYGDRIPNFAETSVSSSKARLSIKEALESTDRPSVGFHIDFAPGSSVMTAQGKERLNLIASSIALIPGRPSFKIHVNRENVTAVRRAEKLAMDRARAIASHLKLNRRLNNELIVIGGGKPGLFNTYSSRSSANEPLNVLFVNQQK